MCNAPAVVLAINEIGNVLLTEFIRAAQDGVQFFNCQGPFPGPQGENHRQTSEGIPLSPKIENFSLQSIRIEPQRGVSDNKSGIAFAEHREQARRPTYDFRIYSIQLA